uniref:Apple domain-containing protein n=1 Tax=Globisporangium ultimum (strain ATCC 200006 / CBS 805.95 / DAOM BR144) TaxID=431595 RepID=K3WCV9_GLOUD
MFDVVIVGSGPGGLVAAEYLSRDPSVSVLILEAGLPSLQATGGTDSPDYAKSRGWTKFDIPGEYDVTIYNPENEKYRVDFIAGPYMWLGKLVGGCSSINAQLYFRTSDSYVTNMKWPFAPDHVQALYDENEQIHSATDRPSPDGNWYLQEGYSIVAKAFRNNGYTEKTINDAAARNAKHKTFGHAPFTVKNGLRDSPANSFWNKMKGRPNVQLRTQAMVSHIKQSQGKATGVVYNTNVEVTLTTRGAVIMAAGALGTSKVLIQSGIGPSDQLNLLNARSDFPGVKQSNGGWVINPNVGQNLFDTNVVFATFTHPDMKSFQYKTRPSWAIDQYMNQGQTGGWASFGPTLIGYENYAVNGRVYEFQTTVLTNGFTDYYSLPNAFTTSLHVNNPEARDHSYFTADGKWNGFTGSLYFGTTNDLAAMQSYATKVVDMMKANGATFMSAANSDSVATWVTKSKGFITHHFGGSCYASSDTGDAKRCADAKLRVLGTTNIFVADASAMRDGTVNPYGFIMYIGREAAGQVKEFVASSPMPPQPATCGIENGIDYIDNDIGSAASATAEGCCSICQSWQGCNAYSWNNANGGTCWLKSAKGETKSDPSVRSSVLNGGGVTPTASPTPTPATCLIENDVDYVANDVGNQPSANAERCCSLCKSFNGCNAFSWSNANGGTCWFKSGKGATTTKSGVHSSVVNSSSTPTPSPALPVCSTIEENVDYSSGFDIANTSSATAEGCCAICKARTSCGAYTWTNYNQGTCWLKATKGSTTTRVVGARSAIVNGAPLPQCNLVNGVDYFGNDFASVLSASASGCCDICRLRVGCRAFTWTSYNHGTCWLKTSAGSAQNKTDAIGGTI